MSLKNDFYEKLHKIGFLFKHFLKIYHLKKQKDKIVEMIFYKKQFKPISDLKLIQK